MLLYKRRLTDLIKHVSGASGNLLFKTIMMNIVSYGKKYYRKQTFYPDILGLLVNPFYLARKGLLDSVSRNASELTGELLDVGCGTKPYAKLFDVKSYCGLEIDSQRTRVLGVADRYYDGQKFPFADNSFDSVLCNQVLEHVFNPREFLNEIHRVLRPGGKLLLTVPFVWDEHEQPFDFARYSSYGLNFVLTQGGFIPVICEKSCADVRVIFQLANAYLFKVSQKWWGGAKLLIVYPAFLINNTLGILLAKILPSNEDFYLDNVVLVTKVSS